MKQLTLSLLALTLSLAGQAENIFVNTPKTTLKCSAFCISMKLMRSLMTDCTNIGKHI